MKAYAAVVAVISLACVLQGDADTQVVVAVPDQISRAAAAQLAGGNAANPILILDDVEVGQGEGLTFSVLSTPADSSTPPAVLATTGVVGKSQGVPAEPVMKMKLVVPLNERAAAVLAGQTSVTLTLRLKNAATHPPLHIARAYFSTTDQPR
jgi:hypothetical protein